MRILGLPKRFPQPQNMKGSSVTTWITWMRDESNELIAAIDEEITKRRDPDDPFDGTASGTFLPLQQGNEVQQQQIDPGQVYESKNRNSQKEGAHEGRLVEIQSPGPQQNHDHTMTETSEHGAALQPRVQQGIREIDAVDTSMNRRQDPTEQRETGPHNGRSSTQAMTQR